MKRKSLAALICMLCLAGCSGKPADTQKPAETEKPAVSSDTAENDIKENDSAEQKREADLGSEEGIRRFLAGTWTLLDCDDGEDFGTLSIKADGSFEFTRISDGACGKGTLSFTNLLSEEGDAPDGFNLEFSDWGKLALAEDIYSNGTGGSFHIGSFPDEDYLYLKEIGNGDSAVSMYAFNTNAESDEIGAWPYDWLFYRKGGTGSDAEAIADDRFYAWAWEIDDDGDGVWLQPMNMHEFETVDEYSNRKFMGGYFTEKEDIGIAYYPLTDNTDLSHILDTAAWNSGYPLFMCVAKTDDKGNVKELHDVDIEMYGVYELWGLDPEFTYDGTIFTINDFAIDMRDYVAATDAIVDCMRIGDWIAVECHINPEKSIYEFYSISNGDIGYFEYEIEGAQLTWLDDDLSTAVYARDNAIYDFWGNMIAYVDEGQIGRIDIKDETTVSVTIRVTDEIGRLKEYVKDYAYEPCDRAVLAYYEYWLGGGQQWRELKDLAGDASALIIVNPPEAMLDRMYNTLTFKEGALDKVVVVPLVDDAEITIESTIPDDTQKVSEKVEKGRPIVCEVTVSEAMPAAMITVKAPGIEDAKWDVVQLSGRIPQKSTFIK
ncbi:MAG: hypothetical protein K6F73_08320 [Lachnospiraceae bacterium]|nr:hypothetical protein [Lachnospiraceae bacterium]